MSYVLEPCETESEEIVCMQVVTTVIVDHYPVMFSTNMTNLIVVSTVLDYMSDQSVDISATGPVPEKISSQIVVTIVGVEPEEMNEEEIEVFEESVEEFLQGYFAAYVPVVEIETINFNAQSLAIVVELSQIVLRGNYWIHPKVFARTICFDKMRISIFQIQLLLQTKQLQSSQ